MARHNSTMVVLVVILVASFQLQPTVAQTRHIVGDALGWTIPPEGAATYATWASKQTFIVGDTLFFNFTTGFHTVAEVYSSTTEDPCNSIITLSLNPIGPAATTLTHPGTHYYICTIIGHCDMGQKLTINVSNSAANAPETPISPSSVFPTPPSAYGLPPPIPLPWSASPPSAYGLPPPIPLPWSASPPSAYGLPPSGSPIPLPWSASPPSFAAMLPVALMAITLAFFY